MGEQVVRYNFRLRPGARALAQLQREWGRCRYVWNALVAESRRRHTQQPGSTFGYKEQDKFLTHLRSTTVDEDGTRWLAEGSSVAQQQTVRDFAAARTKALMDRKNRLPVRTRRGLPRFKKRGTALASMNYTRRGFSLRADEAGAVRLHLAGGITIPVVWSRELPSDPSSVRVYQDSLGHWYASFCVKEKSQPAPRPPHPEVAIGVDWGVTQVATTARVDLTTGHVDQGPAFDLDHPEHGRRAAAELARAQRTMARRRRPRGQGQSRGYRLAKFKAARASKKVARQRKDTANKWARKVAASHERIAVEDFRSRFLAKSNMARKAADGAIYTAKTALIHQARKMGRDLRLVNPAHTTTDCSTCGARPKHRIPLGQRTYACATCGNTMPRDKNSAAIMVARAGFDPADVEGIRLSAPAVVPEAA